MYYSAIAVTDLDIYLNTVDVLRYVWPVENCSMGTANGTGGPLIVVDVTSQDKSCEVYKYNVEIKRIMTTESVNILEAKDKVRKKFGLNRNNNIGSGNLVGTEVVYERRIEGQGYTAQNSGFPASYVKVIKNTYKSYNNKINEGEKDRRYPSYIDKVPVNIDTGRERGHFNKDRDYNMKKENSFNSIRENKDVNKRDPKYRLNREGRESLRDDRSQDSGEQEEGGYDIEIRDRLVTAVVDKLKTEMKRMFSIFLNEEIGRRVNEFCKKVIGGEPPKSGIDLIERDSIDG